jgi:hypothetical protein
MIKGWLGDLMLELLVRMGSRDFDLTVLWHSDNMMALGAYSRDADLRIP